VGTHRWEGVATYRIAILETEVKILDIELQVRKDELMRDERGRRRRKGQLHVEKERTVEGTVLLLGSSSK
jgi:hypothetical protein